MNAPDTSGDQMELTPRIGLSEPMLRPEDAAERLSVNVSWIYEACRTGQLPHRRVKHIPLHTVRPRALAGRSAARGS
jgi:hypothetical protein